MRRLFDHYELTYRAPGERWPRRRSDANIPIDRDVRPARHIVEGVDITTVGGIFSATADPDQKPFDIRTLMNATVDFPTTGARTLAGDGQGRDGCRLRRPARWPRGDNDRDRVAAAATPRHDARRRARAMVARHVVPAVVEEGRRGGQRGRGCRPAVLLATCRVSTGRGVPAALQLEYGAEIGRRIVDFDGPIVLCVVSRSPRRRFVVFSGMLNDEMKVLAVEGSVGRL